MENVPPHILVIFQTDLASVETIFAQGQDVQLCIMQVMSHVLLSERKMSHHISSVETIFAQGQEVQL